MSWQLQVDHCTGFYRNIQVHAGMRKIQKIFVRSTNWIGDAIMTTPAVSRLRQLYPGAHITVGARPWVMPVFQENPAVDAVALIPAEKGLQGIVSRFANSRMLSAEGHDLAVLFPNSFDAALTARLAGIPERAGYATDMRAMLLTLPVPVPEWKCQRHEVYYYLNLVDSTGTCREQKVSEPDLFLRVPGEAASWADELFVREGMAEADVVIGFNPGAAFGPAKCWPVENFSRLGSMLLSDPLLAGRKVWILVLGTRREKETGAEICRPLGHAALNLAGRTDLPQVMAVIERLDLLVTNDSGLMHVGAALDRPLVALFGSTNPVTTGPWSRKSRIATVNMECAPCLKRECPSDFKCMKELYPEIVISACRKQIERYVIS